MAHLDTLSPSTISYMARLKADIRELSLAAHDNNDISTYLIWLQHQVDTLHHASTRGIEAHSDLVELIFQQLLTTKSYWLRHHVKDWHLSYHQEERNFTALSLIDLADKTCNALSCTNQLDNGADPEILALQAINLLSKHS